MQNSARRHVLADVRLKIGLTQFALAKVLGCHLMTVQKIEQGILPLSEEMAGRVETELDVASAWLLANNPQTPPVTPRGSAWAKEHYELAQERKRMPKPGVVVVRDPSKPNLGLTYPLETVDLYIAWQIEELKILQKALLVGQKGYPGLGVIMFRLNKAAQDLAKEYEPDAATLEESSPECEELKKRYLAATIKRAEEEMRKPGSVTVTKTEVKKKQKS
jgi:transcriptional regulator with XRE-family HTH domain